jgi:hypothetical protein
MVLHNYVSEHANGGADFELVERDEDYELMIPKRYNKYVVLSNSFTQLSNVFDNIYYSCSKIIF